MEQSTPPAAIAMAPHQGWSPFRLRHCMAQGQMTPPSSPPLHPLREGPRLQVSKFLRRTKSTRSKHSLSQDESRTTKSGQPVVETEAPLPVLHPESPPRAGEISSIATCTPALRRTSTSHQDLRALAQQYAACSPTTPLLPSPITKDSPDGEQSSIHFHDPHKECCNPEDEPIDSLQILAYYCNDNSYHCTDASTDALSDISLEHNVGIDLDEQSTASESMPLTPCDQDYRGTFCSSESGWLANTTSHDERLRRFKARIYQVVQHPWTDVSRECGEEQVMIATVLVGPGKPKLVHIQRPPSSPSQSASSVESQWTPSTPVQRPLEVSAFSPYDTPCHVPGIESRLSAEAYTATEDLVPPPLSLPVRSKSRRSDSSVRSATLQRLQGLGDPFCASPQRSRSHRLSFSFDSKWTIRDGLGMVRYTRSSSPTTKVTTWSRCRKMERVINAVSKAIDTFPDGMLRLNSPSVLELRSMHVAEQTYLTSIQRIFPTAPTLLISALTAWILIDIYFSQLKDQPVPMERSWTHAAASNESLHRIPDKAREMLGIGLPDATSIRLNEYALRKRAAAIHASIGVIGHRLIEALRGAWDDDIWRSLRVLVEVIEATPTPPLW